MATLPATAVGEVRLTLRLQNGDGTDAPAQGYAWLYPNLREGTRYRASNVDTQVATKTRLVFDTAGNLEDPETNAWAKVLASDAPGATFAGMQWVLEFHLENVERQPSNAYFTVPAASFVNVGLLADTGSQPAVQTIYTSTAPILAALNTTDSAVANLFSTASTTRTTADARYVTAASSVPHYATIATLPSASTAGADSYAFVTNVPGALFRSDGTAWTMHGIARFADTSARSSAITSPSQGMRTYIAATARIETYYAAYDGTTNPYGSRIAAGWYPEPGTNSPTLILGAGAQVTGPGPGSNTRITNFTEVLKRDITHSSGLITFTQPGYYTFSAWANYQQTGTQLMARKGTTASPIGSGTLPMRMQDGSHANVSGKEWFAAGDTLDFAIWYSAGTAGNLPTNSGRLGAEVTYAGMR